MADGGDFQAVPSTSQAGHDGDGLPEQKKPSVESVVPLEQVESLLRSRANTPNPFSRQHTSLDLDDYFVSCPFSLLINTKFPCLYASKFT